MTGMASKERITKEAVGDISEDFKARIVIAACSSPETKDGGFDNAQERGEGRSGSPSVRASPTRSEERSESQEGGSNPPPYSKTHELWQETSLVVNAERPPSSLKAKCSKTPTDPDSPHYGTHGNDFGYTLPGLAARNERPSDPERMSAPSHIIVRSNEQRSPLGELTIITTMKGMDNQEREAGSDDDQSETTDDEYHEEKMI